MGERHVGACAVAESNQQQKEDAHTSDPPPLLASISEAFSSGPLDRGGGNRAAAIASATPGELAIIRCRHGTADAPTGPLGPSNGTTSESGSAVPADPGRSMVRRAAEGQGQRHQQQQHLTGRIHVPDNTEQQPATQRHGRSHQRRRAQPRQWLQQWQQQQQPAKAGPERQASPAETQEPKEQRQDDQLLALRAAATAARQQQHHGTEQQHSGQSQRRGNPGRHQQRDAGPLEPQARAAPEDPNTDEQRPTPAAADAAQEEQQTARWPEVSDRIGRDQAASSLLTGLAGAGKRTRSNSSASSSGSRSSSSSSSSTSIDHYPWGISRPGDLSRNVFFAAQQQQQQQRQQNMLQLYHQQRQQQQRQQPNDGQVVPLRPRSGVQQVFPGTLTVPAEGLGRAAGPAAAAPHEPASAASAAVTASASSTQLLSQLLDRRQRAATPLWAPYRLRQQALQELERRRRIPPVNACSQLPFPYLNAAAAAAGSARGAEPERDSSSNQKQIRARPRGLLDWLWKKIQPRTGGSSRSHGDEDVASGVLAGPASAPPAHSSSSSSNSSSSSSSRQHNRPAEAATAAAAVAARPPVRPPPPVGDAPADELAGQAEQGEVLLPKHLRLHLAMLLSRDDRLYYGETFASCVAHGCGFALYGGGVSRCGNGLWGKGALRRLGCGSLAGECVLLPGPSGAPQPSLPAGAGRIPGLGLPGEGNGELRVADGLQTGLVLAKGPRPLAGYCGFWRLDRRNGWGVLLRGSTAAKYEGQWVDDFRHGAGMQALTQGCRYVGQFHMGQKHGKGVIVYPGGMMYAGEWDHGRITRQELLFSSRHLLPDCRRRRRRRAKAMSKKRTDEAAAADRDEHGGGASCSSSSSSRVKVPVQQQPQEQQLPLRIRRRPMALRQAAAAIGITSGSSSSSSSDGSAGSGQDIGMGQQLAEQMEELRQFSAAPALRRWGVEHVQRLLNSMGCSEQIQQLLREQQVDGPAFLALTDADLEEMGLKAWEERRLILLLVDLLLKLRHRYRIRKLYKSAWMERDRLLQRILIPSEEIAIEGPIGEGGYSRVFKATWRYTQSLDALHRSGQFAGSSQQEEQEEQQQQEQMQQPHWLFGSIGPDRRQQHLSGNRWEFPLPVQSEHQHAEQQEQRRLEPSGEMSVAVKTFRQRDTNGAQRSLYAELSVLSLLRHPNVLLLLGVVGPPFYGLVTEYVSGGSLFDLLHKQRVSLPLMRVVKLAREVALGMSYLHEKGVMHCDLKSPNILLTSNGEVRLCDFGLATIVEAAGGPDWWTVAQEHQQHQQQQRQQQQDPQAAHLGCVGTHHWMAPESKNTLPSSRDQRGFLHIRMHCRRWRPLGSCLGYEMVEGLHCAVTDIPSAAPVSVAVCSSPRGAFHFCR